MVPAGSDQYTVWRDGDEIYTFTTDYDSTIYYENDVLYYKNGTELKAYNVKSKKEQWTWSDGIISRNPIALDDVIILDSGRYNDGSIVINKKTGETIAQGSGDNTIHASHSDYYIKVYKKPGTGWLDSLEVYDYDANLVSTLKINENDRCRFRYILTNGYYFIDCEKDSSMPGAHLYNYNSKVVKQGLDIEEYELTKRFVRNNEKFASINILDNERISVLESKDYSSEPSFIVYTDGKIVEYNGSSHDETSELSIFTTRSYATSQRTFVLDSSNKILFNFLTGKSISVEGNSVNTFSSKELYGGKYVAIYSDNKYIFYDENLKKLDYETNIYNMYSISNEWVITWENGAQNFKIVNILTGEEKEITLENKTSGILANRNGVMVKGENSYKYYKFN